jgi:SAM-dependent methyltransferase
VDLVLCTEVLEHVADDGCALDELARVMGPGAWLVMTVPTPPAVPDANHVREGYRPEDLTRLLADRGFAVAETRFCMHFFFRWILLNWPRLPWCPRLVIRTAARLDRLLPIGPPMDLMVLAQRMPLASARTIAARVQPAYACVAGEEVGAR